MTLFHLREFWNTSCGTDEEFDKYSLCISNIDNSADGFDKIVVSSYNGILRVYKVELNNDSKNNEQNMFRVSDLLLEVDFKLPILQIASGFLLTPANTQLAILHPNKLCVYSLSSVSGLTEHGTSYNILLIYELKFETKAANMLVGSLGQTKGKDIICVQNIDSVFGFYENESFSFGYNWNKPPSPSSKVMQKMFPVEFVHIPKLDLLILVDELFKINCYQYQELAMNSNMDSREEQPPPPPTNQSKTCAPEWSYNFAEFVIDMQTVRMLDKWYVVILGERNLCVLQENGSLFFVKKFDITPSCVCAFANDNQDSLIVLIGTTMCNMLVYQNDVLRWATKIPFVPVCIRRANLNPIPGSIVLLSDQGQITVGYLGTNPSLKIISMPPLEDGSNVEQMEEEIRGLRKMINLERNNDQNEHEIKLSDCINVGLVNCQYNDNSNHLNIVVELTPLTVISNAKLLFHQNDFYGIVPSEHLIDRLENPLNLKIMVKHKWSLLPLYNKIKCTIMFNTENGLRLITKTLPIPFNNLIKLIPQAPTSKKYWLKVNYQRFSDEKGSVANLFDHVLDSNHPNPSSFSFCFNNFEQIHSIIRMQIVEENVCYSVESNDLAGLYLAAKELFNRIQLKSLDIKLVSIGLNFDPIDHLLRNVWNQIKTKTLLAKFKEDLAKFCEHYRVLQKRILVKSKDKTPSSLDSLEKLLSLVQNRIYKNIDKILSYEKVVNIGSYHVWTDLNILKMILKKSRKSKTVILDRFIKLISIHQLMNFTTDWENLFQTSLQEMFNMNKNIENVVKTISSLDEKDFDHLGKVLAQVFATLTEHLLPIEFPRTKND